MFTWFKKLFRKKIPLTLIICCDNDCEENKNVRLMPQWEIDQNTIVIVLPYLNNKDIASINEFIEQFIKQLKKEFSHLHNYKIENIINFYELDCLVNKIYDKIDQDNHSLYSNVKINTENMNFVDEYDEMFNEICDLPKDNHQIDYNSKKEITKKQSKKRLSNKKNK